MVEIEMNREEESIWMTIEIDIFVLVATRNLLGLRLQHCCFCRSLKEHVFVLCPD